MKLEGELAFSHSSVGREPESQSFERSGNDLYSAGHKLQNQKVREYENSVPIDLKSNEQDLDLSSCDIKSAEPKLEFYDSIIDLKKVYGVDSFVKKFATAIKSVKRSPTSPTTDPPEERDSFENPVDVYMDKTIRECEPKPVVCYKESNYRVVKDIPVDEGVPTVDKVSFEMRIDEKAFNLFPYVSNEDKEIKKDNIGINVLNLPATVESDHDSANHDHSQDLMHKDEAATEKPFGNVNKETLPGDKVLLQELDIQESKASDDKGEQVSQEPELQSQSIESENIVEEAVFATPTLASAVDGGILENESFIYLLSPSIPVECHQDGGCKNEETQHTSKPVDGNSDDEEVTSQVYHSFGESSFSAVGAVSSRINYSGPVPYSGSISLGSDSSTASTRSFAFPVLQSEWNSSPVRMAKADKRKYRKHRGWRQGLLCCRF